MFVQNFEISDFFLCIIYWDFIKKTYLLTKNKYILAYNTLSSHNLCSFLFYPSRALYTDGSSSSIAILAESYSWNRIRNHLEECCFLSSLKTGLIWIHIQSHNQWDSDTCIHKYQVVYTGLVVIACRSKAYKKIWSI